MGLIFAILIESGKMSLFTETLKIKTDFFYVLNTLFN